MLDLVLPSLCFVIRYYAFDPDCHSAYLLGK